MVGNPPSRVLGGDDREVVAWEGATVGAPTLPLLTVGNGGAYGGVVVAHGGGEKRFSPTLKICSRTRSNDSNGFWLKSGLRLFELIEDFCRGLHKLYLET